MRLCMREGQFLPDVYNLLNTCEWPEAQRINACITIIEDDRLAFGRWYTKNHERVEKAAPRSGTKKQAETAHGVYKPGLEDYLGYLANAKQGLANAKEELRKHRLALVNGWGTDDGLLLPELFEKVEEFRDIHADEVDKYTDAIAELFPDAAATLPE